MLRAASYDVRQARLRREMFASWSPSQLAKMHPCNRRSVWETGQPQRVGNLCGIARSLEWLPLHELPNRKVWLDRQTVGNAEPGPVDVAQQRMTSGRECGDRIGAHARMTDRCQGFLMPPHDHVRPSDIAPIP